MDDRVTSLEVNGVMLQIVVLRNRLIPNQNERSENQTNRALMQAHDALERERNRLIVREWEGEPSDRGSE